MKEYDLDDYEIIRTQFFASASMTSVSISPNGVRFSMACIRKFPKTEYIELKVHPHRQLLVAAPCSEKYKYKMRWAKLRDGAISARVISGGAFLKTLYELFGWDFGKRYRLRGQMVRQGNESIVMFDAQTPEIFSSRYNFEMPWATSFDGNFHIHKKMHQESTLGVNVFSEYNSEPDLWPTSQRTANKNIQALIGKMHSGSGF